jgi:hypothetical protein
MAQRSKEVWSGLDSVREERGLKMGGWYATITDAGSDSASSTTRVVRLYFIFFRRMVITGSSKFVKGELTRPLT